MHLEAGKVFTAGSLRHAKEALSFSLDHFS
jgi:hypothetical protein